MNKFLEHEIRKFFNENRNKNGASVFNNRCDLGVAKFAIEEYERIAEIIEKIQAETGDARMKECLKHLYYNINYNERIASVCKQIIGESND